MSGAIKFHVPVDGHDFVVGAQRAVMVDLQPGLCAFHLPATPTPDTDAGRSAHARLCEAIALCNAMINNGLPWSVMATCRKHPGAFSAVIEAGHNRLQELGRTGADDAA